MSGMKKENSRKRTTSFTFYDSSAQFVNEYQTPVQVVRSRKTSLCSFSPSQELDSLLLTVNNSNKEAVNRILKERKISDTDQIAIRSRRISTCRLPRVLDQSLESFSEICQETASLSSGIVSRKRSVSENYVPKKESSSELQHEPSNHHYFSSPIVQQYLAIISLPKNSKVKHQIDDFAYLDAQTSKKSMLSFDTENENLPAYLKINPAVISFGYPIIRNQIAASTHSREPHPSGYESDCSVASFRRNRKLDNLNGVAKHMDNELLKKYPRKRDFDLKKNQSEKKPEIESKSVLNTSRSFSTLESHFGKNIEEINKTMKNQETNFLSPTSF